jgi:L-ascorbate metabolism protein UlaG (beta-lactamase superfamily)
MKESSDLAQRIAAKQVADNHVSGWWLGGSGFVFKTHLGTVISVDPYLSDCVESMFGRKRAFPPPITVDDFRADAIISTHWHEDHLDPGSIPTIARNNPSAKLIMPPSAMARALSWGIPRTQIIPLVPGEAIDVNDVRVDATPARHEAGVPGWEVPDAVGVLLQVGELKIYHSGDTEYDVRLRRLKSQAPHVAMLCINGVGGNMDAYEAALLAWHLGAPQVIPIHHLLWADGSNSAEETLDPALFVDTYRRLGGEGTAIIPEVGSELDFEA